MGSFLPPETTEEYYLLVLEEFLSRHGEHEQKRARSKFPFLLMHANTHILLHTHTHLLNIMHTFPCLFFP